MPAGDRLFDGGHRAEPPAGIRLAALDWNDVNARLSGLDDHVHLDLRGSAVAAVKSAARISSASSMVGERPESRSPNHHSTPECTTEPTMRAVEVNSGSIPNT